MVVGESVVVRGDEEQRAADGTFYVTTTLCHLLVSVVASPGGRVSSTAPVYSQSDQRSAPRTISTASSMLP